MKKAMSLIAVLLVMLATAGCSIKDDAYKNKSAQEFIQTMEEIKEDIPEGCEFDYEVRNTITGKAKLQMSVKYNDHEVKMTFMFDNWDSVDELKDIEGQELIDNGIITIKIDGVKYNNIEAAEALMDVYFSY